MSSNRPKREWSLTRRMGFLFAATTSSIVALYAALSGYYVFDSIRDHTRGFMEHELEELALVLTGTDRSVASIERSVKTVLAVSKEMALALRVRDQDGNLIVESGRPRILKRVAEPIEKGMSWREWFFSRKLAVDSKTLDDSGMILEILVDTSDAVDDMLEGLWTALLSLCVAVVLAGLAGWFNVHHGLKGLRQVVAQARSIDSPTDITRIQVHDAPREIREVGAALNSMLARIEIGMDEMRTFTAGLAHELRSPIQNLVGSTEVTLLKERGAEEYRQLLTGHLDDLNDLSSAVDNLVAFCRSNENQERDLQAERFDLFVESQLCLVASKRAAERKGIELVMEEQGDTRLYADREGLRRVVRNLVGNAIQHSPEGSTIHLTVSGEGDHVRLQVEDQGPGIPKEQEERIYEPFFSLRQAAGRRAGYGLGLFICKGIVSAHSGKLSLEHPEAGGSRFIAEFPRSGQGEPG